VADYKIIIDQLKETLELREVASEVGMFYAGKTPKDQSVIIGTIQSLQTPKAALRSTRPKYYKSRKEKSALLQQIVSKCDLLLVDEADRATSSQYKQLFTKWFAGRRRYGFSGTPFDPEKPVENLFLREFLGNIIAHTERKEVQDCGLIVPVHYITIAVGTKSELDKAALDIAVEERMIENEEFHELVAGIVAHYKDEKNLILVESIKLGENLVKAIKAKGINVEFIYGKTDDKVRLKMKKKFESGELSCLIGGKILKRGLDLKGGTDNLIMCNGGKLWSDFNQKVGRAVRRNDRGWSRVIDFYFLNNYYLYKHSRARLKALVGLGYNSTVVFGDEKVDGAKLVKSNFRMPKHIRSKYVQTKK
jgi:superfamily II DNA or RNA helicase